MIKKDVNKVVIDFAIIGAQKAATTTLFDLLRQHPEIAFPQIKEDNYFAKNEVFVRGESHLAFQYKNAKEGQYIGHAYVNLMYWHYVTVPRMKEHNKEMKLIALLRDPVDRAYSAYWYAKLRGWENAPSFEDAIERELKNEISSDFTIRGMQTYLAHGHYAEQLEVFFREFGEKQIRIYFQQQMKESPELLCRDIFAFLNLNNQDYLMNYTQTSNAASRARIEAIPRLLNNPSRIKRVYHAIMPLRVRKIINHTIVQRVEHVNQKAQSYPPMCSDTREKLKEYYELHNDRLVALIGRGF